MIASSRVPPGRVLEPRPACCLSSCYLPFICYLLPTIYYYLLSATTTLLLPTKSPRGPGPRPPRRDSDIWAIYSRLCLDHTLNYAQVAATVDDVDIESLNPGYAQPAHR